MVTYDYCCVIRGIVIINDKINMGQVWPKQQQIQPNQSVDKPKEDGLLLPAPPQSQIQTSDAHLQTILNYAQNCQFQSQNQDNQSQPKQLENHMIDIQSTLKQSQCQQTNSQKNNQLPTHNVLLPLPQVSQTIERQSKQPTTFRTIYEQDENKVQQLYNKLLTEFLPAEELKLIKKQQHKRTFILWLKELPQSPAQQQRDKRLISQGYQVYSSADITSIFAKYDQNEQLCLHVMVLFSYSEYYDSNETMKELVDYFLLAKRISQLILVRPPQGAKLQRYKMEMEKLDVNNRIIQINYQIQLIRNYLLQQQPKQLSSCHFLPLSYWHNREGLEQRIRQSDSYTAMCIKSKINLFGFTKIGVNIVERIANNTSSFNTLAYHYSSLYDNYIHQTSKTKKEYLQKVALLMIEDPIKFYLLSENRLLIDRLLMLVADRLQDITCILLPVILIFVKIKEEYQLWSAKRKYKNQFRCYYDLHLSTQQLCMFEQGQIIENLGFVKAYLQPQKNYCNTQLIIKVLPHKTSKQYDRGYCFLSESSSTLFVDQPLKKSYFTGYDSVLFNLLNSFRVVQRSYDSKQMKHIIELQYGYAAHHLELKNMQDYIPSQHEKFTYRHFQKQMVDITTIVKYHSNYDILERIEDFGDCYSLVGEHSQAITYYEELYRRNKAEIKTTPLLLAQIQEKKGYNYQLKRNHRMALDHYYKAFSYIHKGTITRQLQHIYSRALSLMRRDGLFQKIVNFCQGIIRNSELQKNWLYYSQQFRMDLHQYLAVAYFSLTCTNYHITCNDNRTINHFERGLQLIQQIGEYNQRVAVFYKQLGRHYLIKRQPIQGLTYLNKSLLIFKAIHSVHHPILCEIYEYLAVGYVQAHDYQKALTDINQCIRIYDYFYDQHDSCRIPSLQIKAYIKQKLIMKSQAVSIWRSQIETLRLKYNRDIAMIKKIELMESDVVGVLRNFNQKELHYQGKSFLKMKKEVLSGGNCYSLIALSYVSDYRYKQAIFELNQAIDMTKTELPTDRSLEIELHLLIAQCYLQQTLLGQFWGKVKSIWSEIERNKMQRQQVAVRYHLIIAEAYCIGSKLEEALSSVVKARQLAVKCYGSNSLQYCQIVDIVGRYGLKAAKTNQVLNYFKESQEIRNNLMTNINLNRHTILLYGCDFEQYKQKVKLHLCYSIENRARLLLHSGQIEQAIEKYSQCLDSLMSVVGQFHFYTAHINKELAKILMKKHDSLAKALNLLSLALSVFQKMEEQPISEIVDTYSSLAAIKESMNQLGQCIETWSKVVAMLRKSHKLNNGLSELKQFKRTVQLIMQHQNQNYFRICYYTISNTFEEQKKNDIVLKLSSVIVAQVISQILGLSERLRQKISQQSQSVQEGNCYKEITKIQSRFPTLETIKLKIEERKKKRKAFQSLN